MWKTHVQNVYSGVGKTEIEIENAMKSGVGCVN